MQVPGDGGRAQAEHPSNLGVGHSGCDQGQPIVAELSVDRRWWGHQTAVVTSYLSHVSVDCASAHELSQWWKGVLDYVDVEDDPNEPDGDQCMILSRDGSHRLPFIEVPTHWPTKSRVHLDLEPVEGRRDDEHCILRSAAEHSIA